MWQHNYEPVGGSLGVSAVVAAIPILVLFVMLGVLRKPAWMAAMTALVSALLVALAVYGMPAAAGDHRHALRRRLRHFPDRLDRVRVDHAVPPGRRDRQVRNHQGLGGRAHQRSAPAGDVHRLLVRRVHRRRRRFRRAGRHFGRDARGSRLQPVLCRRYLPAGEHRAGRLRVDRHSRHHARQRDRPAGDAAQRDGRPAVRDDFDHHSRLSDRRDVRLEARRSKCCPRSSPAASRSPRCSSTCRTTSVRS